MKKKIEEFTNSSEKLNFPKGKVNLLSKIQGHSTVKDKLKRKVELFISLLRVPYKGEFSIEIFIKEKDLQEKIASVPSQHSNEEGKVVGILSRGDPVDRQRCYLCPSSEIKMLVNKAKKRGALKMY